MRDVDFPPDEGIPDVRPDDPEEQLLYLRRFVGRYPKETAEMDPDQLMEIVRDTLKLCPPLRIRHPRDVLRLLALRILITPAQKSQFLETVVRRVLEAVDDWSATKRLDFIDKHVIARSAAIPEPDFGPWYVEGHPSPV
jgi:hypothetical protein